MVTSQWRAKLSEYALDSYLKLTRGRLGARDSAVVVDVDETHEVAKLVLAEVDVHAVQRIPAARLVGEASEGRSPGRAQA